MSEIKPNDQLLKLRSKIVQAIEDNARALIRDDGYAPTLQMSRELASSTATLVAVLGWIELLEEGDWRVVK